MSAFLSAEEVRRMTGKARYSAQRRALDRLHVPYHAAATGEPLVRWDTLDEPPRKRRNGPRWDRL